MGIATSSRAAVDGWDGASFRDQKGRVYCHEGRIFRILSPSGLANWRAFAGHRLCGDLMADELLIQTREVEGVPGVTPATALEHAPIEFISYAFEWPFYLLQRAALLHLNLLQRLIPEGFILADATPSNVMFRGIRPVFIDVGSVVPYQPGDVWQGFKQFLQTMMYPLLLCAYKGLPYQAWIRGAGEEGLPASHIAGLFGWHEVFRPGVATHVKLNAALERFAAGGFEVTREELRTAGVPTAVLLRNIRKLRHIITKLRPKISSYEWVDYDADSSYGAGAHERKRLAVRAVADRLGARFRLVWDLGCNTGEYSFLLAERATLVVAMDDKPPVVDALCRRCQECCIYNVLPLVIDIANPSPAQGWRGTERRSLGDRGKPDLILALGLLHHLVLTKNLPVEHIVAELAGWGHRCLVEHVAADDPMAARLRRNVGAGCNELFDRPTFEALASRHARVEPIDTLNDTRALYLLESLG